MMRRIMYAMGARHKILTVKRVKGKVEVNRSPSHDGPHQIVQTGKFQLWQLVRDFVPQACFRRCEP